MAHGMHANAQNAHPSSERRYERYIVRVDGKPVGIRKLICATPSCGQEGEIFDRTTDGLPPKLIERRFTQKGWEVGKSPKHDFCPSCVEARTIERRQRRNSNKTKSFAAISNVFPLTPAADVSQPEREETVQATAESPNVMSRADRRIIHAKLEEVYADEDTGYRPGWSDAQVARDLGSHIPVGWVSEVREQSFGPVKDNPEVRDLLEAVQEGAKQTRDLLEECRAHRIEAAKVVEVNNVLMKRAAEIAKSLDGLLAIATRIERMVK